ncbi:hypothetical protein DICPUDRAFT_27237 [Dictyostelium purpureum]|uniref:Ribosomal protein S17 n=1 Tax=Dictyostelium purpureum TaxID=5786 RepID=F0Z9S0_DICPU|nr:uncharacterized protein DICPUDRAFT_27237 [Dictyostelium purpureum]EGC39257.1 hypothetical protein DICPUDRAFT_27237 [Dictyostelium purpureum]|eukprot:XP_003284161.1 hypothetical protein DICPUDRAFT_27237 [Dictyostelium purpureum]
MITKILDTLTRKQRVISGLVISKTHTKTALCLVKKLYFDKGKYAALEYKRTKYMIHDPEDICNVGDQVHFQECAPISKRKTHTLTKIVKRNVATDFIKQNPQYIVTPNEIARRKEQDKIKYTHIADL